MRSDDESFFSLERTPCCWLFRAEVDFLNLKDSLLMSMVVEEESRRRLGEKLVQEQVVEVELVSLEDGAEVEV